MPTFVRFLQDVDSPYEVSELLPYFKDFLMIYNESEKVDLDYFSLP